MKNLILANVTGFAERECRRGGREDPKEREMVVIDERRREIPLSEEKKYYRVTGFIELKERRSGYKGRRKRYVLEIMRRS